MAKLSNLEKGVLILFLGLIFVYSCNPLKESDAFYHIKTGELIWATKTIPHFDVFSYTANGAPWVTHEWLAELVFYLVQALTGFWGLIFFIGFIAVLTYFIIFRLAMREGADFYAILVFLFAIAYWTFSPFWIARPQVLGYLALALLLYFLTAFRREKDGVKRNKYLWFIVFDIWFWANINASFLLGLVILIFYFCAEIAKKYLPFLGNREIEGKDFWKLGLTILAAILISFINPNTYKVFLYPFYVQGAAEILKIAEWRSVIDFWNDPEIFFTLAQMAIIDLFLAWRLFFKKSERDIVWLGIVLGISIMPFISLRHYAFWPIAAMAPLAVCITKNLSGFTEKISRKQIAVFLIFIGLIFAGARFFTFPRQPVSRIALPVGAADFIISSGLRGPLFNLYNEGGYLIYRLWPEEKVFIDGRSEVYGIEQLKDFLRILLGHPSWNSLVNEKYEINYFVLAYQQESLSESIKPLVSKLFENGWITVFWDDSGLIFARNSSENAEIINKYGFKYINPFRDPANIPAGEAKAAAEEISRLLERSPDSIFANAYAKVFLLNHK